MEEIGNKIFLYRADKGLSQREFAKKSGVSFVTICRLENKKQKIKADTYGKIMKILNLG